MSCAGLTSAEYDIGSYAYLVWRTYLSERYQENTFQLMGCTAAASRIQNQWHT